MLPAPVYDCQMMTVCHLQYSQARFRFSVLDQQQHSMIIQLSCLPLPQRQLPWQEGKAEEAHLCEGHMYGLQLLLRQRCTVVEV